MLPFVVNLYLTRYVYLCFNSQECMYCNYCKSKVYLSFWNIQHSEMHNMTADSYLLQGNVLRVPWKRNVKETEEGV